MIVSQFQAWAETASAPSRADGVSALARATLYSDLGADQRRDAVRVLTGFLDDPSPLVRRALADAFASAADAPHHIILALADDQPAIAAIVLRRSPILTDAELIDCAALGDGAAQTAIAARPYLSVPVVAALAEVGVASALVMLAGNPGAVLPDSAIKRMIARHGGEARLREALLARGHLPIDVRADLVAATARALAAFVAERAWMPEERMRRAAREATEKATITIAATGETDRDDLLAYAAHLRETGQLTVALVFRALLSGNRALFNATLCDLTGLATSRVAGLTRHFESAGFAALYRRAGFPLPLLPAFRLALDALEDRDEGIEGGSALSEQLIARVLAGCAALGDDRLDTLMVLLRRFESEAAREAIRNGKPKRRRVPTIVARATPPSPLPRAQLDAMLLAGIDYDEAVPMERAVPMTQREPARFTIDLAAIEAELMAA